MMAQHFRESINWYHLRQNSLLPATIFMGFTHINTLEFRVIVLVPSARGKNPSESPISAAGGSRRHRRSFATGLRMTVCEKVWFSLRLAALCHTSYLSRDFLGGCWRGGWL